jgi:hypothetical protein
MPDLTVRSASFTCGDVGVAIGAEVCDRGTEPVADGVPVAVYGEAGELLCVAATAHVLRPGLCEQVSCTFTPAPASPVSVGIFVDDDGTGAGDNTECREGNNKLVLSGVACP